MLTLALEAVGVEISLFGFIATIVFSLIVFWVVGIYIDKKNIRQADISQTVRQSIEANKLNWAAIWDEVIEPRLRKLLSSNLETGD